MYTQGLAFEGIVYLAYAMSLGTRTGPDNYDSCLGNPLQALIHDSFNSKHIGASPTRWVDDFLGLVSFAHHGDSLLAVRTYCVRLRVRIRFGHECSFGYEDNPTIARTRSTELLP